MVSPRQRGLAEAVRRASVAALALMLACTPSPTQSDTDTGADTGSSCVVETEICDNGLDDDCDGLVDCEDGECVGTPLCTELCDNGQDDDIDGLTDCEDDECWGLGDCYLVETTLLSGRFESRGQRERASHTASGSHWTASGTYWMSAVTGSFVLANSTQSQQCGFSIAVATLDFEQRGGWSDDSSGSPIQTRTSVGVRRQSVSTTGACGLHAGAFLPGEDSFTGVGRVQTPQADGIRFYKWQPTSSVSTVTMSHRGASSSSYGLVWSRVGDLVPGGRWRESREVAD